MRMTAQRLTMRLRVLSEDERFWCVYRKVLRCRVLSSEGGRGKEDLVPVALFTLTLSHTLAGHVLCSIHTRPRLQCASRPKIAFRFRCDLRGAADAFGAVRFTVSLVL